VVAQKRHGVRDSLLFSWAEETGGRRKEILSINIAQLPSPEELERLIEEDRPWHIRIVRKGGKKWELIVLPDLLMRTLDYIRSERKQIVETHGVNPEEVFLSERGHVLRPDSLTKLGKKAFEKAGVHNSNVHRFRAKFLLATIEALIDAMDVDPERVLPGSNMAETILVKAVEVMGHSSVESLRPYLNYALNRRVQNSKAFKLRNLDAKIRQLFHREAEARERLRKLVALDTLLRDLGETGHEEVAKRLSAILA
jgi:integrase